MTELDAKTEPRNLRINLDTPVSRLNAKLQRMLNVIRVLEAGSESVTQEQLTQSAAFMSFHPSAGATLPLEEAKHVAQAWLNNAFLRDAIDAAGLFLDEYITICSLLKLPQPVRFGDLKAEHQRAHGLVNARQEAALSADYFKQPVYFAYELSQRRG
jgi:hypothetical protein